MSSFSIIKNWERLLSDNTHPDGKSLRVINGIRFYNIIAVLLAHASLVGFGSPTSNPIYVEQVDIFLITIFYFLTKNLLCIDNEKHRDSYGGKRILCNTVIFCNGWLAFVLSYAFGTRRKKRNKIQLHGSGFC